MATRVEEAFTERVNKDTWKVKAILKREDGGEADDDDEEESSSTSTPRSCEAHMTRRRNAPGRLSRRARSTPAPHPRSGAT